VFALGDFPTIADTMVADPNDLNFMKGCCISWSLCGGSGLNPFLGIQPVHYQLPGSYLRALNEP